ncbi:hypothetical protein RN001_007065 [Aquatica leii]|uniref:Uncharacterized protein n=1 Tax=Aquatica leii TaxID=1421715 RepID=A0AAN7P873_9COLE|nr:hypothetical protein RN001_007065 [Aquatica leii]
MLLLLITVQHVLCQDFNNLLPDGSYSFGYNNPDSYHQSQANRNNVVRGEFGSRNPGTGAVDSVQYTAGPRGFRPRGKNVVRKYDFNQVRTRPIGSPDDPFYDPNEDPSYNFAFNTRTYNRQEAANRVGDVTGKYSYLDDVGELHNVEFIAGKNTGFHVKSAVPDNKPLPFSPLQYVGKRKPVPRGRSTVQRGLDGSYRFVSGGPDHRRTETSDSTGHVRGSYTYLDDKGVRHSVHYIAGPETGYRVLKNVKGPHLPTILPFGRPETIPPDFYEYPNFDDVFDTAASGHVKPSNDFKPSKVDNFNNDNNSNVNQDNIFGSFGKPGDKDGFDLNIGGSNRPGSDKKKPSRPSYEDDGSDVGDIFGSPFGGSSNSGFGSTSSSGVGSVGANNPQSSVSSDDGSYKPIGDDGSYKPNGEEGAYRPDTGGLYAEPFKPNVDDGAYRPSNSGFRPGGPRPNSPNSPASGIRPPVSSSNFAGSNYDDYSNEVNNFDLFDGVTRPSTGGGNRPNTGNRDEAFIGITQSGGGYNDRGTLVTNVGDTLFSVPPGVSVRAHVQAIDLLPLGPRSPSPSDQLKAETNDVKAENSNTNNRIEKIIENKNISTTSSTATKQDERPS